MRVLQGVKIFCNFVQMLSDECQQKLQDIVRGEYPQGINDSCTAISYHLCKSFGTSPTIKSQFESNAILKEKQAAFLKEYAEEHYSLLSALPSGSHYLTEGGEAKVYLANDYKHVIKVNDAGYYATWTEYFTSLIIHNLLFPNTPYKLLGFKLINEKLFAVLEQPFIEGEQAALEDIQEFLEFNGFVKTRRQDYYHPEFHLVLEDMHDENVITKDGAFFFIDTVFYIIEVG